MQHLEAKIKELQAENEVLKQTVSEKEADIQKFVYVVKSMLSVLGIFPIPENVLKTIMKKVPSIITKATIDSKGLEKDFAFLVEIKPLIEKYIENYGK